MDAPKKKKRGSLSWTKIIVLALVIVAAGGLFAFAVLRPAGEIIDSWGTDIDKTGAEARVQINTVTGGSLPASAGETEFHGIVWTDYSYWMRFSIPAAEFDAWLKQAAKLCFGELQANGDRGISGSAENLAWWNPDAAQTYLSAEQCSGEQTNAFYNILVDTSDASSYIVYLNVFST